MIDRLIDWRQDRSVWIDWSAIPIIRRKSNGWIWGASNIWARIQLITIVFTCAYRWQWAWRTRTKRRRECWLGMWRLAMGASLLSYKWAMGNGESTLSRCDSRGGSFPTFLESAHPRIALVVMCLNRSTRLQFSVNLTRQLWGGSKFFLVPYRVRIGAKSGRWILLGTFGITRKTVFKFVRVTVSLLSFYEIPLWVVCSLVGDWYMELGLSFQITKIKCCQRRLWVIVWENCDSLKSELPKLFCKDKYVRHA